jgi:hypothetical protein
LLALLVLLASATAAGAHSAERGFVLLLPTSNVIAGGALAVAVSFAVLRLVPERWFKGLFACDIRLGRLPPPPVWITSLASFIILLLLIWAGFTGSRDPLENLLVLGVWTLWWVVLVLVHPVIGNLWAWLNPFAWLRSEGRFRFPAYWPALMIFAAFTWFHLVSARPEDPEVLALAVGLYLLVGFSGVAAFGTAPWLAAGDPFSVFLRQLGAAAPFGRDESDALVLRMPGAGLARLRSLPIAGVLFILLTLSSVSFDGFANTFLWLAWGGINPLDFPGRTAVMGHNTLGLFGAFVVLAGLYWTAIGFGWMLGGGAMPLGVLLGRFVFSLIPISIAFHFAHYLSDVLVNGQYLLLALGLQQDHPTTSFLNTATGALVIYAAQTAAIVIGHVIGVAVGHLIAIEMLPECRAAMRLELPLAVLMVAYTALGLWTLSAPAIG